MKKQELFEKLSHYLPYGLNLYKYTKYKEDIGTSQEFEVVEMDIEYIEFVLENDSPHYDIKPILRPLSDLKDFDKKGLSHENDKAEIFHLSINKKVEPSYISMSTYLWLLKNHFDVFGLIEQGLAMDINLKK